MSGFGHYNPRHRYRMRDRQRTHFAIAALSVLTAVAMVSFWLGRQHAAYQINSLSHESEEAQKQIQSLQDDLIKMRTQTQTATLL